MDNSNHGGLVEHAASVLQQIANDGLTKKERAIAGPQGARVKLATGNQGVTGGAGKADGRSQDLLNLCANNYLGLADDPELIAAAKQTMDTYGFGMASVRFICGTQDLHQQLEKRLAKFLDVDDAILFSSCFDANGALFETLLDANDAVISDALNHASIIDGVRLCKARRLRYDNNDMQSLEQCLQQASDARNRLIVTDGVFSMDGIIADLPGICALARKYQACVVVDDSHAVGFMGNRGAGTPEYHGVEAEVDILTGTFGKALGGASGGYVAGPQSVIDLLRQRGRPYLFSNSLAPAIAGATLKAIDIIEASDSSRQKLDSNTKFFRVGLKELGYDIIAGDHPIIPIMIGDAVLAVKLADILIGEGVYVTAFSFPVVPRGAARIRVQMSAALNHGDLEFALSAFAKAGKHLNIIA